MDRRDDSSVSVFLSGRGHPISGRGHPLPSRDRIKIGSEGLAYGVLMQPRMSEGINKAWLLGNLGNDPELRYTPGGQALLQFRLATTDSYLDKNNTKQERTEWHKVTVWGKRGESMHKLLVQGSRVSVIGRIHYSSYEKDGVKKYSSEIVADDLVVHGTTRPNGQSPRAVAPETTGSMDIPF